jgi:hypothetical protein
VLSSPLKFDIHYQVHIGCDLEPHSIHLQNMTVIVLNSIIPPQGKGLAGENGAAVPAFRRQEYGIGSFKLPTANCMELRSSGLKNWLF